MSLDVGRYAADRLDGADDRRAFGDILRGIGIAVGIIGRAGAPVTLPVGRSSSGAGQITQKSPAHSDVRLDPLTQELEKIN
ncbi:hypothetical protein [Rhizobium sp. BT03]|uniref:hypothetical protein n=1 Tax=Rhizobium sp. BT03 TaxID=3045156 RepID=UPI0024B3D9C4|nr:hypothetical protein [Rhizobium sp. BT03]WHO75880.1 hypothetical protein QMO80_004986 [Rhizobium sp. BT03]